MEKGWVEIDVSKLKPASWNYKEDDAVLDEKLEANIKANGQIQNVIVRTDGDGFELVNGNHRLNIFKKLGFKKAFCYNLGDVPLHIAQKIAIETNETSYDTNQIKLSNLIKKISQEVELVELRTSMPFSDGVLDAMLKVETFDINEYLPSSSEPTVVGNNSAPIPYMPSAKPDPEVHVQSLEIVLKPSIDRLNGLIFEHKIKSSSGPFDLPGALINSLLKKKADGELIKLLKSLASKK